MTPAPIILFAFNRPVHTRQTIEALRANEGASQSDLIIYADGPKSEAQRETVQEVRAYLRTVNGFKSVTMIERETNRGLAASIIAGVTEVFSRAPAVIVMEDDLVSAPDFLTFMNEALRIYRDRADIFSVTGYNYPLDIPPDYPGDAYLSYRGSSWGWGSWVDRWRKVDWSVADLEELRNSPQRQERFARGGDDLLPMLIAQQQGLVDSWSIRFDYAHSVHDAFCLHPIRSKIQNIGFDASGVHCEASDEYRVELDDGDRPFSLPPDLALDPQILAAFDRRFRQTRPVSAMERIRDRLAELGRAPARWFARAKQ